jgi:signal peptidase I
VVASESGIIVDRNMGGHRVRFGIAVVTGRSMAPTLVGGDRLLVRYGALPNVGDLVVVRLPGAEARPVAVKRVTRREAGGWWVERDNPSEGVDSWTVGAVPDADVLAVVVTRVWPLWRPKRAAG